MQIFYIFFCIFQYFVVSLQPIYQQTLFIMKKSTFLLVALMAVSTAFAQISTGEPHSSVIPRTGNRPQAGDLGMYIGASVTQIMDLVELNKDNSFQKKAFWALPVINLKFYFSDNFEGRLGFQFACQTSSDKVSTDDFSSKSSRSIDYTRFLPGFAYHFNTNNILDVYLGAQIPIGFNLDVTKSSAEKFSSVEKNNKFVVGGGIFLGLQFFVADLPFAIGFEGGYSGLAQISSGHRKIVNNDGEKQISLIDGASTINDINSASHMEATWGADAAITFTYYFRK